MWVHPRYIVHAIFPEDLKYTTPPHQDFQPVRRAPDTWTEWVPYGVCPYRRVIQQNTKECDKW